MTLAVLSTFIRLPPSIPRSQTGERERRLKFCAEEVQVQVAVGSQGKCSRLLPCEPAKAGSFSEDEISRDVGPVSNEDVPMRAAYRLVVTQKTDALDFERDAWLFRHFALPRHERIS